MKAKSLNRELDRYKVNKPECHNTRILNYYSQIEFIILIIKFPYIVVILTHVKYADGVLVTIRLIALSNRGFKN